jgi:hypothetical protein
LEKTAAARQIIRLRGVSSLGIIAGIPRRVKILKRPGSRIEGGHQGVLDSGRAGEP